MHEQEEESVIERCPLYILVYACSFLHEGTSSIKCVSRKWAAAVQQLELLKLYLAFDNAECINYYLDPLFDSMQDLVPFRLLMSSVVDECTKNVEQRTEASMAEHQKALKTKHGLRNFVSENCSLFYRSHQTNWIPEGQQFSWRKQSLEMRSSDGMVNSDFEDDDLDEDDGFRYYADEEDEGDSYVPRWYRKRKHYSDNEDYDD